jgi:hypothetical protein
MRAPKRLPQRSIPFCHWGEEDAEDYHMFPARWILPPQDSFSCRLDPSWTDIGEWRLEDSRGLPVDLCCCS